MAKRSVEKYDFKAFGQAIKAARTERKESRKKVSDEMYIMGKCGCFLSCTYIRIVFCLSMSGKVGHNIAIRTSQLFCHAIHHHFAGKIHRMDEEDNFSLVLIDVMNHHDHTSLKSLPLPTVPLIFLATKKHSGQGLAGRSSHCRSSKPFWQINTLNSASFQL